MKQPDTLLTTTALQGELLWFSSDYLKQQIELAYQAGAASGTQVNFLGIGDYNTAIDYAKIFWHKVQEDYQKRFDKGEVWRVAGESKIMKP